MRQKFFIFQKKVMKKKKNFDFWPYYGTLKKKQTPINHRSRKIADAQQYVIIILIAIAKWPSTSFYHLQWLLLLLSLACFIHKLDACEHIFPFSPLLPNANESVQKLSSRFFSTPAHTGFWSHYLAWKERKIDACYNCGPGVWIMEDNCIVDRVLF